MKSTSAEALRFLAGGAINTALTYLLYLLFLNWVEYVYAFSLSFIAGIGVAFVVYSSFVFRTRIVWRRLIEYPALYVLQYAGGLAVLVALVEYVGLGEHIAPLVSVVVLLPVTFAMNKWFLTRRVR